MIKKWRIGVSIPVPRRCERRTLPIELIPHDEYVSLDQKDILGGTRTLNLEIRSLTPYPLGHEDGSVQEVV